ncbi:hypothetical protein JCM30566_11280 [Marinitoga arctica]
MRYIIGLFFILMGILFVFQGFNFDLLFRIATNFSNFWSFILIIIGVSIISKNIKWLKWLNIILVLFFLVLLIFWDFDKSYIDISFKKDKNYEKMNFEILPDSTNMNIYFVIPALTLDISIDESSDKIYGYYYGLNRIKIDQSKSKLRFYNEDSTVSNNYKIHIILPKKITYKIFVNNKVSNVYLNNLDNVIKNLYINSGVSNLNGSIKTFKETLFLNVDSGVSNINLELPKNTTLDLNYDSGVKNINIDKNIIRRNEGDFKINIDSGVFRLNLKAKE